MASRKKIEFIEKKIKKECKICEGIGCNNCRDKTSRIMLYEKAGIPVDYWLLAFKDFKGDAKFKEAIADKLSNIDKMYEEGQSLAFVGNFGTGKTFAACSFLKKALVSDYTAKYYNMTEIISGVLSDDKIFFQDLTNYDFLVIDEFSKRFIFTSEKSEQIFGQTMEHVLRTRFQNKMPTILCSNDEDIDTVLDSDFSKAFSSLRKKYVKIYCLAGNDFRKSGV